MDVIQWCNENNGFLTAILSVVGLMLSVIAIVISIHTARLPYTTEPRKIKELQCITSRRHRKDFNGRLK